MFWSSLQNRDQEQIETLGIRRSLPKNSVLFLDHDRAESVIIILDGQVKLSRAAADGTEMVIELRGAGMLVGELASLDDERRIATATTTCETDVLVIAAHRFRELLLLNPRVCFAVLLVVTAKLRQATDRRLVASSTDSLARLAGRLVELAHDVEPDDDGVVAIHSPFTQQELAEWIGMSRDAVVLALRTMRQNGWIETGRKVIRIRDLRALRSASGALDPLRD